MKYVAVLILLVLQVNAFGQLGVVKENFNRADSLRGGTHHEHSCYDVQSYDLQVTFDTLKKSITGSNKIKFYTLDTTRWIQIDLFENLEIVKIDFNKSKLQIHKSGNATFIEFEKYLIKNDTFEITIHYQGIPQVAKTPPWDGGFIWKKDAEGNQWIAVACQGTGASCWWPCKDHQSDEPTTMTMTFTVPRGYTCVSNGRLIENTADSAKRTETFKWKVSNPINTYNVTFNIGKYIHYYQKYSELDCDFYVMPQNFNKAKEHFKQVEDMLNCFQTYFGDYPFRNDGFKLVETPYLGMEHQSCIAYGNGYKMGYRGTDLSGTGVGMSFDYIIVHEAAHEWFGNSITSSDICDMWIHEGFGMYAEAMFVECKQGKDAAYKYLNGLKKGIDNDRPIAGKPGVNNEGSGDMYNKGALMLHTIRNAIDNDDLWLKILLEFNLLNRHSILDANAVIKFFYDETGIDWAPVFHQYLYHKDLPVFEYKLESKKLLYRWNANEINFNLPIKVEVDNVSTILQPTSEWKKIKTQRKKSSLKISDDLYLITVKNLTILNKSK